MSDPTGIEEQLHKRADAELKKAIEDLVRKLQKELIQLYPGEWPHHAKIKLGNGDAAIECGYETVMACVETGLIRRLKKPERERAVKEFMQKVDTLGEQLDELRDEIQYQE